MSDPDVFQIMKSNAILYFAPVGEAVPDDSTVAAGTAWGGNWARLGATKEPLTVMYEDERSEVNIEEALSAVHRFRTSEKASFETVLAELSADYLQMMTGGTVSATAAGAAQVGFDELPIGNEAFLDKYAFGFEGVYVNSVGDEMPLRMFLYRATAKLNGEMTFSKREDDYTGVPILIEALSDTSTLGNLVLFQKMLEAATG